MKKIIDSIGQMVAEKAAESVKQSFDNARLVDKLLVIALALIGLSAISVLREIEEDEQKDSRKSH